MQAMLISSLVAAVMALRGPRRHCSPDWTYRGSGRSCSTASNFLVVPPLVLALSATFPLAPLVIVTQTLVELIIIVIFVRLVPQVVWNADNGDGHGPGGLTDRRMP